MNVALRRPMSREEFFAWAERQEARYEFDGFQPVAMTGGNLGHSSLHVTIGALLFNQLRGKSCRPLGPDAGVATIGNAVRYPDAVVTCTPYDQQDRLVPNPVIVFEVISPTSGRLDRIVKLREYQAVPSIRRYVLVESAEPALTVFFRTEGDTPFQAAGLVAGEVLDLPEVGIAIPVDDIYEGLTFADPTPA